LSDLRKRRFHPVESCARHANATGEKDSIFVSIHFNATGLESERDWFEILDHHARLWRPLTNDDRSPYFVNCKPGSRWKQELRAFQPPVYNPWLGHIRSSIAASSAPDSPVLPRA